MPITRQSSSRGHGPHVGGAAPARMVARVGTTCGARDVTCDDLHARRREYIVAPTSALSKQLREIVGNSRDLPLVYLLINVVSTVPAMGLMLLKSVPSHALGLTYFACVHGLYLQRFAGVEAIGTFAGVSSRLDGGASDECDGADVADAAFRDNQWVARVVGFDDARWGERDESGGEISER